MILSFKIFSLCFSIINSISRIDTTSNESHCLGVDPLCIVFFLGSWSIHIRTYCLWNTTSSSTKPFLAFHWETYWWRKTFLSIGTKITIIVVRLYGRIRMGIPSNPSFDKNSVHVFPQLVWYTARFMHMQPGPTIFNIVPRKVQWLKVMDVI